MPRKTIVRRDTYKKGAKIDNVDYIKGLIENDDLDCLELRETTIYSDDSEEIVVAIKLKPKDE